MRSTFRSLATVAALALLATACGGGDPSGDPSANPPTGATSSEGATELAVAPASFDLAVGEDQRFLAGVFTADRQLLLGGEVEMTFSYYGEDGTAEGEEAETTTATFLPVPGEEPEGDMSTPRLAESTTITGVYQATTSFDRAGIWGVEVTVELDGESLTATSGFQVAEEHQIVAAGDPAPEVENLLVGSDAPLVAIDSRAGVEDGAEVPDPQLHDMTVADAISSGKPTVVVIATPVYCVSRFCGPIVSTIEEMEAEYGDAVNFIHIEVWKDFDSQELNEAAAEWIQTDAGGAEPWTFLIDEDGVVEARWDNVLDEQELRDLLDARA